MCLSTQAPRPSHAAHLSPFFCLCQDRRTLSSVNVSFDPMDDSGRMVGAAGMSCISLQASQCTAAFCTTFLASRTLGKWLCSSHRSTEGPQLMASARSSTAVSSHKLISPPEIHISSRTLTLNLLSHRGSSHQRVKPASPRQKHCVAKHPLAAVRITQQFAIFLLFSRL